MPLKGLEEALSTKDRSAYCSWENTNNNNNTYEESLAHRVIESHVKKMVFKINKYKNIEGAGNTDDLYCLNGVMRVT